MPARIIPEGKFWYNNGELHRENDLPAVIKNNGEKGWLKEGKFHRTAGPAYITSDEEENTI